MRDGQRAESVGSFPVASFALAAGAFVGLLALILVAAVVFVQVSYDGRIYPGVRALGVAVGGMTRDQARAALADAVAAMSDRSIVIGFKELRWTVAGHHLGGRPAVESVVEEAFRIGRGGDLLSRLVFQLQVTLQGEAHDVHTPDFDPVAMEAFMQALAGAVDRPPSDARLALTPDGRVELVDGQPGRRLQAEETERRLEEAIAQPEITHVDLAVDEELPRVGGAELSAVRMQAEALVGSPLVAQFEALRWELAPNQLAAMATIDSTEGVRLDHSAIKAWVTVLAREIEQEPQDARFSWQGGVLSLLRPSKDGRALDVDRTIDLVMAQAVTADRTIALPVSVTRPDVSEDDADKLQIQGSIEVARTSFAGSSPPKQHNIGLATQRLNGVVVPPGKMFSFNKEVGSTSLDAGYKVGWGITSAGANVKTVPSVAGGICQVATTLFHTVFWGGYQVEERNYHLYWIPGYTSRGVEGLDATVDEEAGLDFRFINNTEHYLLIQSWVEGGRVVFGLYGTVPDWTVKVQPGERANVTRASQNQIIEDEPTLPTGQRLAVEGAMDGFKVTDTRTVTRPGEEPRILRLVSSYRPSRNVMLVGTGGKPAGPSQVVPNRPTAGSANSSPSARPTAASGLTATPAPTGPAATPAAKPSSQPAPASKPIISPLFPSTGFGVPRPAAQPPGGR